MIGLVVAIKFNTAGRFSGMAKSAMKALGTLFEQRFVLKCLEHGLHPFSPIEEGLPQDLVVMNHANELIRVQIKGTKTPVKQWKTPRYKITAATGKSVKKPIECDRVDIVVCHVDPDAWYIIPCEEVKSVRVWLYPYDREQFRSVRTLSRSLGFINGARRNSRYDANGHAQFPRRRRECLL